MQEIIIFDRDKRIDAENNYPSETKVVFNLFIYKLIDKENLYVFKKLIRIISIYTVIIQ